MPRTEYSEAALARRREKFDFVAGFPGLLLSWADAERRTVASVVELSDLRVLVFTDGRFLVARPGPVSGETLLMAIESARSSLTPTQSEALAELDRLIAAEKEAMRLARMEKVLGAVETNLPQVPELRNELQRYLDSLEG